MDGPVFCFVFESRLEGKVGGEKIEQEFADAVASWLSVPRSGKKVLWFSLSFFLSFGFFFFFVCWCWLLLCACVCFGGTGVSLQACLFSSPIEFVIPRVHSP